MHCDFLFYGRTYNPGREEKDFFLWGAFSHRTKDAQRKVPTVGKRDMIDRTWLDPGWERGPFLTTFEKVRSCWREHPHLVIGPLVHANSKKLSRTSHMQGNLHVWFWPGFPEGDRSTSFPIALGLCLDLPRVKSKGLVPMEIPLGLIPRLMMKRESAWHKVKIGGAKKNSLMGSEGIRCPTTDSSRNCVIEAKLGIAVSGHPPSPVREALLNTLRKDVHRARKTWS
nr:hypothetical protein [Tanacetum cinerariifolium]